LRGVRGGAARLQHPDDTPLNPFHTRELAPDELATLVSGAGFVDVAVLGLHHGSRLRALDAAHGGSLVEAPVAVALAGAPWPVELLASVTSVTCADLVLHGDDVAASLDLAVIAQTGS